jgi:methylphosphotriester-DNA--protein-cysteine methyltransferase
MDTKTVNNHQELVVISKLEMLFESCIYLNSNFRLFNLAIIVGFPPVELSKLIKKSYGISFTQWMLLYRLNYLDNIIKLELINNNKIKFNNLIKFAGFNSRSNFYYSFNKMRNSNPKQYYNL